MSAPTNHLFWPEQGRDTTMTDDYDFHTDTQGGTEVAGVLFVAGSGQFYEFVDPGEHDHYALWRDPRTGEEMVYSNELDRSVKRVMGGHIWAHVDAEEWDGFREEYINAPEERTAEWGEKWEEIHTESRSELVTAEG